MKLVIVESPAKAKTIGKYLGKNYIVMASVGHVRDLPKSEKNSIDIPAGFVPRYQIAKGKEAVVEGLARAAKKADEVILATDPDREGEAIAWHIKEALGLPDDFAKRIVFHEITESAVKESLAHPRGIDENLRQAQEARRVLDRLFGYDLSRLIWQKLRYGLSAGRVQSPALRILTEREREIRAFVPEHYWVIEAVFKTKNSEAFVATPVEEKFSSAEAAAKILVDSQSANWQVGEIKETSQQRAPRAPFTTSTLQQAASSRLGFSPTKTMVLAQKLYEAGHITYMRTDSVSLSTAAIKDINAYNQKTYGKLAMIRRFKNRSKNAQEAHEAVRPTSINRLAAGRTAEEKRLYELIRARTLSSQMCDALLLQTKVTIAGNKASLPAFIARGVQVANAGWLTADPAARTEEMLLPKMLTGDKLTLEKIDSDGKETSPPPRYSEAGLIKELERRGIGRPSTYAPIIKTLLDRNYAAKENRSLRPTETGEVVSEFLEKHFQNYISDIFTSDLENNLDDIAKGGKEYRTVLKDFYDPFGELVAAKKDLPKINTLGEAPGDIVCPKCDGKMVIKLGRSGKFFSCGKFPECGGARTIDGQEMSGPKETGEECPACGGKLVTRQGRYGEFIACSSYPKCKYVKKDEVAEAKRSTGVACSQCHTGIMVEKRGRYGAFFGCSNYPKCRYVIKARPTGKICPLCNSLMMEGTKTIPERCSDRTCANHNPHKLTK